MNNEQNFRKFCPIRPFRACCFHFSLPKQEYDDFERHIEENDFGIGIL